MLGESNNEIKCGLFITVQISCILSTDSRDVCIFVNNFECLQLHYV